MAIIRCKMCGGDLEVSNEKSSCTCDFCGTIQTVPNVEDENIRGLFNRANTLRLKSEFDKASEIYEKIIQLNETESEAYWGLILCKYGIEYVEEPVTLKRIPTCHRASYDAILVDEDYKNALKYADVIQREIYQDEAQAIDDIQKGILQISEEESDYDIFICYKETDDAGKRTEDSVIANGIYHELTESGYKVFFAAITLEDKIGSEYEPYIFSALNSAKAMLVIGTKPEYLNAVWVKNEWSRFLKLKNVDKSKILIPCYRDMDAYDLPAEFSHLQAQDLSRIDSLTDLVRRMKKVIPIQDNLISEEPDRSMAFVKRGNMALEDCEWEKADGFFENALDLNPECAEAYLGKLLSSAKVNNTADWKESRLAFCPLEKGGKIEACEEDINRVEESIKNNTVRDFLNETEIRDLYVFDRSYVSELDFCRRQKDFIWPRIEADKLLTRARQFASGNIKEMLDDLVLSIENELDDRINAAKKMDEEAIEKIKSEYAIHLENADNKASELKREALKKWEDIYQSRIEQMDNAGRLKSISEFERIAGLFDGMGWYKESLKLAEQCRNEAERLKEEERIEKEKLDEAERRRLEKLIEKNKRNRRIITITVTACVIIILTTIYIIEAVMIPNKKYEIAQSLYEDNKLSEAYERFLELDNFKDSKSMVESILNKKYEIAKSFYEENNLVEAYLSFLELESYKDSEKIVESIINTNPKVQFIITNVGDKISFGNYNGKTRWNVLAKENDKLLIISEDIIDEAAYNLDREPTTWEKCTLRDWLNSEYLHMTFDSYEMSLISPTENNNPNNIKYETVGGNKTLDSVFLLSEEEAKKYISSKMDENSSKAWWLRSPGCKDYYAQRFDETKCEVDNYGTSVNISVMGVRPVLWIDLSKL